jgi:hypothetical protein
MIALLRFTVETNVDGVCSNASRSYLEWPFCLESTNSTWNSKHRNKKS